MKEYYAAAIGFLIGTVILMLLNVGIQLNIRYLNILGGIVLGVISLRWAQLELGDN